MCAAAAYCAPRPVVHQVLDVKLPFDEKQLLTENLPYLLRSLNLESLNVHSTAEAAAVAPTSKMDLSQAHPGQPVTVFSSQQTAASS